MLACSLPDLEVATFNLYEWNVGANNRWGALYSITELRMVLQLSGSARKSSSYE